MYKYFDVTLTLKFLLFFERIFATSIGISILSVIGSFLTLAKSGIVISDTFELLSLYLSERTIFWATTVISADEIATLFGSSSTISIFEAKFETKLSIEFRVFCNALDAVAIPRAPSYKIYKVNSDSL